MLKAEKKRVLVELSIRTILAALSATGFFRTAKVFLLVARLILAATLTRVEVVIFLATRALLTEVALILLTCSTHVPIEVVFPHSVICHLTYPPLVRSLFLR